jgi:hypothetical protein
MVHLPINFEPTSGTTLQERLYNGIRDAVLAIRSGCRAVRGARKGHPLRFPALTEIQIAEGICRLKFALDRIL